MHRRWCNQPRRKQPGIEHIVNTTSTPSPIPTLQNLAAFPHSKFTSSFTASLSAKVNRSSLPLHSSVVELSARLLSTYAVFVASTVFVVFNTPCYTSISSKNRPNRRNTMICPLYSIQAHNCASFLIFITTVNDFEIQGALAYSIYLASTNVVVFTRAYISVHCSDHPSGRYQNQRDMSVATLRDPQANYIASPSTEAKTHVGHARRQEGSGKRRIGTPPNPFVES
ncbi:MAG: hypothetical protein LQ350_002452 [Teloschistes chrysophthalmus]|nr:MAG: hypothetical protein LQ350_002452 [Niorma chrysophthalma]